MPNDGVEHKKVAGIYLVKTVRQGRSHDSHRFVNTANNHRTASPHSDYFFIGRRTTALRLRNPNGFRRAAAWNSGIQVDTVPREEAERIAGQWGSLKNL